MIKGYLAVISLVLPALITYGLIVPFLISCKSDLTLLLGFIITFGFPVLAFCVARKYIKTLNKHINKSKKQRGKKL